MASNPPRKQNTSLPPKRGRVKAQIFESLAGAAKAVLALAKVKGDSSSAAAAAASDASASASVSASTSTTPPASTYASDEYPEHA